MDYGCLFFAYIYLICYCNSSTIKTKFRILNDNTDGGDKVILQHVRRYTGSKQVGFEVG